MQSIKQEADSGESYDGGGALLLAVALQGPHKDLLGPHTELLGPHTDLLGPHTELLGPHKDLLGPHKDLLGPHTDLLGPHTELLGPHTDLLGPQTDLLGPHKDLLGPHKDLLGPQTDLLGPHKDLLGPHTELLGPHTDLLGPHTELLGPGPPPGPLRGKASCRRKREFIPEEKKDPQYWERRRKNNEAAKRSREKRRQSERVLGGRLLALGEENAALRAELRALKLRFGLLSSSAYARELQQPPPGPPEPPPGPPPEPRVSVIRPPSLLTAAVNRRSPGAPRTCPGPGRPPPPPGSSSSSPRSSEDEQRVPRGPPAPPGRSALPHKLRIKARGVSVKVEAPDPEYEGGAGPEPGQPLSEQVSSMQRWSPPHGPLLGPGPLQASGDMKHSSWGAQDLCVRPGGGGLRAAHTPGGSCSPRGPAGTGPL
ncbi:LOW QUALITY PROTEIN: nuclear factor interleukin-3-regulated protein [Menidia menidia]